jgi:hypothetical protein
MQRPDTIEFEGLTVQASDMLRTSRRPVGPIDRSWSRTSFEIPDAYSAPRHVEEWLETNCTGVWTTFHFTNPKSKDYSQIMVVRFADLNDALFFKLRDGHRAWEGK